MKILTITLIIFPMLFAGHITTPPADEGKDGVNFYNGTFEEALKEAKEQGKPIFIDAYAAWCGPCKWMSAKVFPRKNVGEFYNKNFISYKYDMESNAGRRFAQKYKVRAYPTLIYLDPDGEQIMKVSGAIDANQFIELGKEALEKMP